MALAINLITTCQALTGGAAPVAGQGSDTILTVSNLGGGDWTAGDNFTIQLTDTTSGVQTQVGFGNVTGLSPTFAMTFEDKLYFLSGPDMYISALTDPTDFDDVNAPGDGFIELGNQAGTPENQVAMAPYQGYMAIIARRTVQIFAIDPDPSQNARQQTISNIGTFAKLSVQSLGDQDVLFLADSGFRSIRPRVASLNAEVIDLGTPVDSLVQALLVTLTDAEKATACAVVEPSANRYMCYVPGHAGAVGSIYALSKFGGSGQNANPLDVIEAWTTYTPSYQIPVVPAAMVFPVTAGKVYAWTPALAGDTLACSTANLAQAGIFTAPEGATTATVTGSAAGTLSVLATFIPERFWTYLGQVYVRAGDNVFIYGGLNNNTYDACGMPGQIPFLDCDTPSERKLFTGIDTGFEGSFQFGFCSDYNTQTFKNVYNSNQPSYQLGNIPLGGRYATHFSVNFNEVSSGYARLSSMLVHFNPAEAKK